MKTFGRIFFILAIMFSASVTWLNLSWKNIEQLANSPSKSRIDYYLSDFTLVKTDAEGKVRYQVTGHNLTYNQQSNASEIYQPYIEARSKQGELVTIKSHKATQAGKSGNMSLTGEVKVHKPLFEDSPEFTLTTQNMVYSPSNQTISSSDELDLVSNQGYLQGKGFTTNLDEQELRILSNVQAEFEPAQ